MSVHRAATEGSALALQRRTAALLDLLEDDSPVVLMEVKQEFARMGRAADVVLKRACREGTARRRSRARQLLLERARRGSVRRLVRYASRPEHDLERALFLLDQHGSPGADLRPYKKALDAFGGQLMARLVGLPPGEERALALTDYLAGEIGFCGSTSDFHHPDNIYLHRAIERREGMPLTLCAVYSFTARRAGLQTGLLHFPGHVLLSITDGGRRFITDPFGEGSVLSEQQCADYLASHNVPMRREFFEDASNSLMFLRHVNNLIYSCRLRGRHAEARDLELARSILSRDAAPRASHASDG